jgi:outer membrane protein TolC
MTHLSGRGWLRAGAGVLAGLALAAAPLRAQAAAAGAPRPLSLEEALSIAERNSEQLDIAQAGVLRARGQAWQARAARLPQLNATLGYDRALASEFEGAFGGGRPDSAAGPPRPECEDFVTDPSLPLEERLRRVEAQLSCEPPSPFSAFSDLPFGRENTVRVGLSLSQSVFTGGRLAAQARVADVSRDLAEIQVSSSRAQLLLEVTQAYYDAVLAQQLTSIAEATLRQAETTLQQTLLARQVGTQPEFELLRAQVTADNQRPVVIQRQAARDIALLRLRQLLEIPAEQELALTDDLTTDELTPVARFTAQVAEVEVDSLAGEAVRAPVRQSAAAVDLQRQALRITRSQRFPTLSLNSQYGRVAYPTTGLPVWGDFRTNWTVGAVVSVPLFSGGRIHGEELVARADLQEAEARLRMTRELAQLDTRSALEQLQAARATWEASGGTVEQASRAYQIAEIRFREGISTQVELSDARILLQQAQANRAQAARDLQVARARVALLPDLPLGTVGGGQGGTQAAPMQVPTMQQAPAQAAPRQAGGAATQAGLTGAR